jgi:DNA-binding MarR family transcriptional regulator
MIVSATVAGTIVAMSSTPPRAPVEHEPLLTTDQLDAWRALINVHARLTERIERDLAKSGLPPLAWYDVLWACYRHPMHRLRMSGLAEHTVFSRSGLTRLVDRMEAAGVLERQPTPGDRRGAFAVVTAAGHDLLRQMWTVYGVCVREHFADRLSAEELRLLADALSRVR